MEYEGWCKQIGKNDNNSVYNNVYGNRFFIKPTCLKR